MGRNYVGFHRNENSITKVAKEYIITLLMIASVTSMILYDSLHNIENTTKKVPMPHTEFRSTVVIGL